jgi:hypothetical protein
LFEIKVATQEVSLWYFHVYMCYSPNLFSSSNYLHSTLMLFLCFFFKLCPFIDTHRSYAFAL